MASNSTGSSASQPPMKNRTLNSLSTDNYQLTGSPQLSSK
jgi:hypothetical protein